MTERISLVPKRRFKEFRGKNAWEQRKLREMLAEPVTDGPHETPKLEKSGIPFISVDAIVDNQIDFDRKRGYISKKTDELYSKKYRPQFHDVFLVKSGSTVGKSAIVETKERFNIWSPLAAMRVGEVSDPYFLYFLLQTINMQNQVKDKASNGTQPNLGMRELEKFHTQITPNLKEQKKIGEFFRKLDNLIALHQRKLEKTKALKSAYLSELFPAEGEDKPKRRFAGFTQAWEQRKFDEEVEFYSGLTYSPKEVNKSGTFVLRSSNVKNGEIVDADNVYVNSEIVNSSNVKEGDIIVVVRNGSRSLIGKHAQIKKAMDKTVIGAFMTGIRSQQSNFINALLDTHAFKAEVDKNLGATINQITNGMFRDMQFMFPDCEEQKKIGDFFNHLDQLITFYEQKLNKLQNLKRAYLHEMFV